MIELRRHRRETTRQLHVRETVKANLFDHPSLRLVYRRNPRQPEYLILVELIDFRDQLKNYVDTWLNRLKEEGVNVEIYYFLGDPQVCYARRKEVAQCQDTQTPTVTMQMSSESLHSLAHKFSQSRLWVIGEGRGVIDAISTDVTPWMSEFKAWRERAWLSTQFSDRWGQTEKQIYLSGFSLVPFNVIGMNIIAEHFVQQEEMNDELPNIVRWPTTDTQQNTLLDNPRMWLKSHAPDQQQLHTASQLPKTGDSKSQKVAWSDLLIDHLKQYLGERGQTLLSACALYPMLNWHILSYLDDRLSSEHDDKKNESFELKEDRLLNVVRLPWFRHGYIPDYVREALYYRLSRKDARIVNRALRDLLNSALENTGTDVELTIAQRRVLKPATWLRDFFPTLRRGHPLRDYIFMSATARGRLPFALPLAVRKFLYKQRWYNSSVLLLLKLCLLTAVIGWIYRYEEQVTKSTTVEVFRDTFEQSENKPVQTGFTDKLRSGGVGPVMIKIPEGRFTMGSPNTEEGRYEDEGRLRDVTITAFALSQTEVTFAEYDRFAEATGREKPYDEDWGRGTQPVINVTWKDAEAYAQWLSNETGRHYHLPSEAQWEYAARAGSQARYSWGDEIGRNNANCAECGSQWDDKQTAPVKSFASNSFGLYDMHGNVFEWVKDCWHADYTNAPIDGSAWLEGQSGDCSGRVIRGGSWYEAARVMRSAIRFRNTIVDGFDDVGFRVARTLDQNGDANRKTKN